MTEAAPRTPRTRASGHPALASRILAVGVSAAATMGLVVAMASRAPVEAGSGTDAATVARRPVKIVVVVRRSTPRPTVRRAERARRAPRIVRRTVRRRAATSSRGS